MMTIAISTSLMMVITATCATNMSIVAEHVEFVFVSLSFAFAFAFALSFAFFAFFLLFAFFCWRWRRDFASNIQAFHEVGFNSSKVETFGAIANNLLSFVYRASSYFACRFSCATLVFVGKLFHHFVAAFGNVSSQWTIGFVHALVGLMPRISLVVSMSTAFVFFKFGQIETGDILLNAGFDEVHNGLHFLLLTLSQKGLIDMASAFALAFATWTVVFLAATAVIVVMRLVQVFNWNLAVELSIAGADLRFNLSFIWFRIVSFQARFVCFEIAVGTIGAVSYSYEASQKYIIKHHLYKSFEIQFLN
jgi:hypothetical protein